jgi:hypothetical protein
MEEAASGGQQHSIKTTYNITAFLDGCHKGTRKLI